MHWTGKKEWSLGSPNLAKPLQIQHGLGLTVLSGRFQTDLTVSFARVEKEKVGMRDFGAEVGFGDQETEERAKDTQTHLGHSTVGSLYSKPSSSITNGVTFVKLPLVKFECSLWVGGVADVAAGTVELEPVVELAAVVVTGGAPIV
ncbi:uncharacterized protein Dyak_GE29212, isoform C [Drosophila yakuba]|uniref:Uncharacterized protein, isoform C n=1 Tax=Drosophila yakuba TaxID=7245 RepID=A0A0R1DXV3_DROYA|nr:uncharacterized protein Dyak_GE29212, isoform C [Drosophila yakuba]